jgi:hypothetical protein
MGEKRNDIGFRWESQEDHDVGWVDSIKTGDKMRWYGLDCSGSE